MTSAESGKGSFEVVLLYIMVHKIESAAKNSMAMHLKIKSVPKTAVIARLVACLSSRMQNCL